jgi:glycolate oxidase iron-sulfur subunit
MGEMIETYRAVRDGRSGSRWKRAVGGLLLRHVIPSRTRLRVLTNLLYVYQQLGFHRPGGWIARRLSRRLGEAHALLPPIGSPASRRIESSRTRPEGYGAEGPARMRVGLFLGCIAGEWFAETHLATIRVLNRNGIDVHVPEDQSCCGALHRHAGRLAEARKLFERNLRAFRGDEVDAVIVNAAGCGAALKEPPPGLTAGLEAPVRDVCEFLDEVGIRPPTRRIEARVAYDQPCHLVHAQQIGPGPVERMLDSIPGVERVPLVHSDRCCGSGGVYNILQPEMASRMLQEKVDAIRLSRADFVVTGNPGCILQIRKGLLGSPIRVLHPVELLDWAYSSSSVSPKASEERREG